jgi:aspartyl protease family protein
LVVLAGLPSPALAQSVSLQGSLGANKALLVIDGQPQTLAVGATARGVTLRRLVEGEAEVEVGGQVRSLRLGEAPSRVGSGGAAPGTGGSIVLPKASGGHFHATGSINGKTVQFMVDTGATTIALGRSEADRIGLDWKHGRPGMTQTANGTVPVHGVTLASVRVGDVVVTNIAAVVVPMDMSTVLLGNSFLDRFNMRRENDVMRLDLKR